MTSYEYDTSDRLMHTELPDGNDIETEYMANGQKTTDPNGKTVTTRIGGLTKEVERLWNGSPSITTTTYDILGRQIALLDAKGHTWTYVYDSLNRQREENDPDAGDWFYEYDAAGRPLQQTDAKGQVTTMTYDSAGRIATKTSPVGTVTYTYSQPRTGYFNTGHLTSIDSLFEDLLLDYDLLGRTPRLQRVINGIIYPVTKSWDAGGYLIGTTYPDGDTVGNGTTPLGYDEAGRLKSIPGFVSNITYDAAGRPLQKTNAGGNNAVTNWTYHPQRGFLTGIGTTSSAGTLQNLSYGYDASGLVQNSTQQLANTSGGLTTQSWTYGYDSFDHLTSANDANTPANSQTWNYDEIGRILSNSQVGTYQYPLPGEPRPHAPKGLNNAPPDRTYDLNGHLTNAPGQTLIWDGENRLSQAVVSGTTTNFAYDSVGERIGKASGTDVSFYPFGDDYEIRNGTVTKYISVEGLGVVAKRVATTNYWLHTDRQGSIQVVTNSSGSPQLGRTYRPYGETLTPAGSHTEFRGWIDQRNDSETGFTYLHARYFDPKLGQFLSPDRIRTEGGMNLYAYGFGDPTNNSDRSGLDPNQPAISIPTAINCSATIQLPGCPTTYRNYTYFLNQWAQIQENIRRVITGTTGGTPTATPTPTPTPTPENPDTKRPRGRATCSAGPDYVGISVSVGVFGPAFSATLDRHGQLFTGGPVSDVRDGWQASRGLGGLVSVAGVVGDLHDSTHVASGPNQFTTITHPQPTWSTMRSFLSGPAWAGGASVGIYNGQSLSGGRIADEFGLAPPGFGVSRIVSEYRTTLPVSWGSCK